MRIGGIASGMDTEQMIKELMNAQRVRVNKYYRQEESIKWRQEALNTTNKTLADFILKARSGFGLTSTSSTGTILNKTKDSFDWVKKVSVSDENIATATASASAMAGTHTIKVGKLASVASVKSVTISVVAGETTMADVVKQINNAKDGDTSLGLRAAYDSSLGKLMITTKDQGKQEILINAVNGDFAESLANNSINKPGQDAEIYLNGDANVIRKSSNNFSIFGINYQLKSEGEFTVNVETNVDGIMDKVKSFVEDYNALIDNLNGLLKEKSYRDYQPLTKEEKEAMKDKEIELWEERAKSGLLRGDESINRMLQSMRSGLYENVLDDNGNKLSGFSHITQIGITTGNYQSGGKLEIDEDKLRAAIIDNPEGVIDLLFQKSDTKVVDGDKESATKKRKESGLIDRLFSDMIVGMKDIVKRSGTGDNASLYRSVQYNMLIDFVTSGSISLLDKDITSVGTRIAREESLLISKEQRYWKQFTAMEKAMQKMNSQGSWLAAQLGQR